MIELKVLHYKSYLVATEEQRDAEQKCRAY